MVCLREATKGKSQQQHQQQQERQDASARIRASEVSQALRKVSMERKKLRASERARETAERDAQEKTAECERLRNKLEQVLKRKRPQNHPKNHRSKQDRSFVERGVDELYGLVCLSGFRDVTRNRNLNRNPTRASTLLYSHAVA